MKAKVTIAQALTCQFAFGGCGRAIAKRDLGIAFWDMGGAIAKRDLGIAFWDMGGAIAKRDLGIAFGGCGRAITYPQRHSVLRRNRFFVHVGVGFSHFLRFRLE